MQKPNTEKVAKLMKEKGIKKWMLADYLGCCEMTVTRMFRHEMTDEKANELVCLIIKKAGEQ